jgi:hypothetical protein
MSLVLVCFLATGCSNNEVFNAVWIGTEILVEETIEAIENTDTDNDEEDEDDN